MTDPQQEYANALHRIAELEAERDRLRDALGYEQRIAELESERNKLRGLLGVARCPNCDGSGSIAHQVGDSDRWQEQCQWCYEKYLAL